MFLTAAIRLLKPAQLDLILRRRDGHLEGIDDEVRVVLDAVGRDGDIAVVNYTERLDGVKLDEAKLLIGPGELEAALGRIEAPLRAALERTARQIEETQKALLAPPICIAGDGVKIESRPVPVVRAGIHLARGVQPVQLLGGVIAARVAGVEDITVTIPPSKDGTLPDALLAAAAIARADRILLAASLPGIAALAHGTDSVARVEKLAGSGSRHVSVAKKLLFGHLDLDMLSGPSEIIILADAAADPEMIALDLCGHAEQDPATLPLVITPDAALAKAVREKLARLLKEAARRELIQAALMGGGIMLVESLDEGLRVAERIAPEILQLAIADPDDLIPHIRRAGMVLAGQQAAPALALSQSGLSATLPTGGTARFNSGLSANFFRRTQYIVQYTDAAARREGPDALLFAQLAGLASQVEALKARTNK